MKKRMRRIFVLLCSCILLVTSVSALSVEDARKLLEEHYIYELPAAAQNAQTLDELFSYVSDPYTYYMSAPEYDSFLTDVEGESSVTGIGAGISYTANGIEILSVLPGGGAEEVGLVPGDLIISIEGTSCVPASEVHRAMLVGQAGTKVCFTVKHENGATQEYTVTRRTVTILNTTVSAKSGIGYIDCDSFGNETGQYFIDGIEKYDASVHDWIVDLRGNSGGVAGSAVTAVGAFVGAGPLLYYKTRSGNIYANYSWESYLTDYPAIVLTNSRSASASEIFAANIAGCGGGIVVGSRTYGKGVAQQVFDQTTNDCFDGDSLKITVFRFYCVNGNTTDMVGVIPTLVVPDEQTKAVAELLCGNKPTDGSAYLHLVLNQYDFYVNLPSVDSSALSALLTALPPNAEAYYGSGSTEVKSTPTFLRAVCQCDSTTREFSDISFSEYADEINTLAVYEILRGNGSGSFRPNDTMTRAEVCALLAQVLDIGMDGGNYFSDVSEKMWYASPINALAYIGLIDGVGSGKFNPNGKMTQQEFFTVMGRLAEYLNLSAWQYLQNVEDSYLSEQYDTFAPWARKNVSLLNEGIADGDGNALCMLYSDLKSINATADITREQAAATMYRTLTVLDILSY